MNFLIKISICFFLFLCTYSINAYGQSGALDESFNQQAYKKFRAGYQLNTGQGKMVYELANGKYLIGGQFSVYNGDSINCMIKINSDGSIDTNFNSSLPYGYVHDAVEQADGRIIVAGSFSSYNGIPCKNIVRLNSNGSIDATYNVGSGPSHPNGNSTIFDIALDYSGKLIAIGGFSKFNDYSRKGIVRLNTNGSVDQAFDPGTGVGNLSGSCLALQPDGKILLGGSFSSYSGSTSQKLVRILPTGAKDESFTASVNGWEAVVKTIHILSNGKILVGGNFTGVNLSSSKCIARLNPDGSSDNNFISGSGLDSYVSHISSQQDGKVIVAGGNNYNGIAVGNLFRLESSGNVDTTFKSPEVNNSDENIISFLVNSDDEIIIRGYFTTLNNYIRRGLAKLTPNGDLDLSFALNPGVVGYNTFGNTVMCFQEHTDGKILVGGNFNEYNGFAVFSLARIYPDGTLDITFHPKIEGTVYNIAIQNDGKILIVGDFTKVNGIVVKGISRLNSDGSSDNGFDVGAGISGYDQIVYVVKVQESNQKIIIGGDFNTVNGIAQKRLARLNPSGAVDSTFSMQNGPNDKVRCIEVNSDGSMYVSGEFTNFGPDPLVLFNENGSINNNFNAVWHNLTDLGPYGVFFKRQSTGKIIVWGLWNIVRLQPSGIQDTSFIANLDWGVQIEGLHIQSDDKILIAGHFDNLNDTLINSMARFMPNGGIDLSFDPGIGFGYGTSGYQLQTLYATNDDVIYVGGWFSHYQGKYQNNLARIKTSPFSAIKNPDIDYNYKLYPNPTEGLFTISSGKPFDNVVVNVYNSIGLKVKSEEFNAVTEIQTGIDGNVGIYYVEIVTNNSSHTLPVFKR
ncbi:MAG: hypothetical protein K0R65_786 [Crocinitomicaceae bacterium]|jgi:uncharacterized delta-60 repeat protein|nr:hypothetical protein [Crocinitomicaceae bacterium]